MTDTTNIHNTQPTLAAASGRYRSARRHPATPPLRWLLALALGTPGAVAATEPDPLFQSDDVVDMRIEGPLRSLMRDRNAEPEYRPARLTFTDLDGASRTLDIEVRPRGNRRRDHEVCKMPPLRLNLPKDDTKKTLFHKQDKLKLVAYCKDIDRYEQNTLKEYLIYRMLNVLTDTSFKVRLVRIAYVDTDNKNSTVNRYGFFIEHKDRLAKRLGTKVMEPEKISPKELAPEQSSLMEVFEFMIANTDFSFLQSRIGETSCCHNAMLLEGPDQTYLPVPYDFDITGFVNPSYATTEPSLKQRNVRDRLFRGFCRPGDSLQRALAQFDEKRAEMLALVENQPDLDKRTRDTAMQFLQEFFRVLDDPDQLNKEIVNACR